jgi:hypothetical protein
MRSPVRSRYPAPAKHQVDLHTGETGDLQATKHGTNRGPTTSCDRLRDRGTRSVTCFTSITTIRCEVYSRVPRVDWRLGEGGSPIRPPLSPHRRGGRSEPLGDAADALDEVLAWSPATQASVLPLWVEAVAVGDWASAERLGHSPSRKANGEVDRSGVDLSIALAFRNAGMKFPDFKRYREPGGTAPSPKAVERGAHSSVYLLKQWEAAMSRPPVGDQVKVGLDRLEELLWVLESDPALTLPDRQVLHGVIALARHLGKTSVAFSYREISEWSGASLGAVADSLTSGRLAGYLSAPVEPTESTWHGTRQYRLLVHEALGRVLPSTEQSFLSPPMVRQDCSQSGILLRTLPVFADRQEALGQKGYQALAGYSFEQARTRAEALALASDIGQTVFYERSNQFVSLGILVPDPESPKRLRRAQYVDWDRVAKDLGVLELPGVRAARYREHRRRFVRDQQQDGDLSAAEAVDAFASLAGSNPTRVPALANPRVPENVDPFTGEILRAAGPAPSPHNAPICRCCGRPTDRIEPTTGLPWHDSCLMPAWIAAIEERHGATIPRWLLWPARLPDEGEFADIPRSAQELAFAS